MFERLQYYQHCGSFKFGRFDDLKKVCNAPTNKSGVYMVWTEKSGERFLLYIGRSGKMVNGVIEHRKAGLGGMKDRLVNGHQFGKTARKRSWPMIMEKQGISELDVYWYDTGLDDPVEVEHALLAEFQDNYGQLPPWNSIA